MYTELKEINKKPKAFEFYTADALWADEYRSKQMLEYHLDTEIDVASRNKKFIDRSVDWIVANFSVNDKSKLCDFGCAVGFYTSALAKTGADVTGIDFSKNSIEYAEEIARKEALNIRYVHQNYLDYQTDEKYDLITMIMCDFCALSPVQRKRLLEKFRTMLNDGGAVLLDVYSLVGFGIRKETVTYEHNQLNHFWSANDYYGFLNTFKYEEEKVVLDKYTIIEEQQKNVIYNWLQYYSIDMLKTEFEASGLTINAIYNDVAGSTYSGDHTEFAVVAVKREKY
ncbi:class I SAM-dependent methyltransferase [Sulfurimonas sp. HSL3-7]|uniref:SAM-dependent methyltransferase n=1 Tax=Sulfonitrofixus jiaomeiensis TaxID=3131938 RepID=UPI0031F79F7F